MMIPIVLSRQLRQAPAATRVKSLGGEEVLIPVVEFIQSTYKVPSYKLLGDGTDRKSGNKKERPRGRYWTQRYTPFLLGNQAIPAMWQNSGNVAKLWQCGKINVPHYSV